MFVTSVLAIIKTVIGGPEIERWRHNIRERVSEGEGRGADDAEDGMIVRVLTNSWY